MIPNLTMYHLLVHTNRDIKRRENKYKDSTLHTTACQSVRNSTVKLGPTTDTTSGHNPLIYS